MRARARFLSLLPILLVAACSSEPTGPKPNAPLGPSFDLDDEDQTAPVLTALGFSPAAINTTDGSATITVEASATDDLSGVANISALFYNPSVTQAREGAVSFAPGTTNGSGSFTIHFPQFSEPGTWSLNLLVVADAVGNNRRYSAADLQSLGFPTDLTVVSVTDATPPALTALSFSPAAINTTDGSATITVEASATDDLSGVANISALFYNPSVTQAREGAVSFAPGTTNGSGSFTVQFPQFSEPGTWSLNLLIVADALGNNRRYSAADLQSLGFPTDLTVVSVTDATPPTLTALSFSPTAISTTSGSASITVDASATDDISGVANITALFYSPSVSQAREGSFSFAAGTMNGSGSFTVQFPQFSEQGTWSLNLLVVADALGNNRRYSAADLQSLGFPTDLLIHGAEPVSVFLHGSGGTANPPTLFLDDVAPAGATEKYKDSPAVKFAGGNLWKDVGTWTAAPALLNGQVAALDDVRLWVGLKNSDDIGTRFDIRVEARKNGVTFATGETRCVQNVVRNANQAREVFVGFAPFSAQSFNGTSDVVSLRIQTRVGTNSSGGLCGGHSSAVGLRVYFDATTRPAGFEAIF